MTTSSSISPSNYASAFRRLLASQNLSGYLNMSSTTRTSNDLVDEVNVNSVLATGAGDGSSLAEISTVRYDTVPLIRGSELTNWFGNPASDLGTGLFSSTSLTSGVIEADEDRTVELIILPNIRQREVRFKAKGLMPNTRHYPFFDGVRVDKYCYPITLELGDAWQFAFRNNWDPDNRVPSELAPIYSAIFSPLVPEDWNNTWNPIYGDTEPDINSSTFTGKLISDANGELEGVFFIPNNTELSFDAGSKIFSLYDITSEDNLLSASRARATYTAQGIRQTVTETVTSTYTTQIDTGGQRDPIAQTFKINNREGVFITKVAVYFQSKDPGNIPIEMQIRPTVNGYPSATEFLPGTSVWLTPSQISVSEDASVPTYFTLPTPTYLRPGLEYAITLISNSLEYNVWISRMGDFPIGETDRKITTQPSLGSLFKSQNSTTWEPSQFEDLKFKLFRAKFATSGTAIFENEGTRQRLLPGDPLIFDSGDNTVRVIHPNHGFFVNDTISIRGLDSASDLPVAWNSIRGDRTITQIDGTGYTFEADSAATSSGRYGGTSVKAPDQVLMDQIIPSIDGVTITNTYLGLSGKFTSGKSLAGTETPYGKDTTFDTTFKPYSRVFFNNPRLVATYDNEVANMGGARSVTIQAEMGTTSDYVSPVINAERASITAINNIIDNQDSAATNGYNVPLTFVNETDPTLGSALAKHVTKPVTLSNEAVGMKILLSANRPVESNFKVYYKAVSEDTELSETNWTLIEPETNLPADTNPSTFREYRYLVGGLGGNMDPFTVFQIKIVMNSTNSSRPPSFRDLRVIALTV